MNDPLNIDSSDLFIWSKNKQQLEEIIIKQDQIISTIEHISPSTSEFTQLQQKIISYKTVINKIDHNKLPTNPATLVINAKESFDKIVASLYRKYDLYAYEEINIQKIIKLPTPPHSNVQSSTKQSSNLQELLTSCSNYANIKLFDQSITNWPKANELYLDLATLSSIQQEHQESNYLTKYSSINAATELQTFKTTLETALLKEKELKRNIVSKHKIKPLSPIYNLLTLPVSKEIPEIITDISKIMQTPLFYFEQKNTIIKETEKVNQINLSISTSPALLDEKYIQELTSTNITRKPFETKNTIYLQPIFQQYLQSINQLASSIQLKKEEMSTQIRATRETISHDIDTKQYTQKSELTTINTYHNTLQQLISYSELLKDERTTLSLKMLEHKIEKILSKYQSIPHEDITTATVIPNDSNDQYSSLEETRPCATINPPPILTTEPKPSNTNIEYPIEMPPFSSATEVLIFAHQYGQKYNTSLSNMCLNLSGYNHQDKMTRTPLSSRVEQFLASAISPTTTETEMYNNLKTAVKQYLV